LGPGMKAADAERPIVAEVTYQGLWNSVGPEGALRCPRASEVGSDVNTGPAEFRDDALAAL
jgi:hypothetical protein